MTRFLDIGGLATRVVVDGPPGAPALLLIHSLGSHLQIWDAQAAALARGYRVIRYDLRGHGGTELARAPFDLDDLAADGLGVLDALGVDAAHVAGVSIGGLVAQAIAARAPTRVRSLVLIGTALAFPPPELWRQRAATVRAEGVGPIAEATLARWVSPAFARTPAGRGLATILLANRPAGYAAAAEVLATADLSTTTPTLRLPATVIVGEHDPSSPVAAAQQLAAAIPGARLVILPGAYHVPLLEHADEVTAAMQAALAPPAELAARGAALRAEVLGADHVARSQAAATELDRDFLAYLTEAAWGRVWGRPDLERRVRSLVTIGVLAALGHDHELALHLEATHRTGASLDDVREVLLHVAVYAGVPAANAAMRVAKRVLAGPP